MDARLTSPTPDLVVLDLMLPGIENAIRYGGTSRITVSLTCDAGTNCGSCIPEIHALLD